MNGSIKKELFDFLSGCVTARRLALFERVAAERTRFVSAVLEDIVDPNDACAVMRSAEIFGFQDLRLVSRRTPFKMSPGVTVGSSKWLTVHRYGPNDKGALDRCIAELRRAGVRIAAVVDAAGALPAREAPLDQPLALCFGSDQLGLSRELLAAADMQIRIPTRGLTPGFNLSVQAALCFSALRSRLAAGRDWRLSEAEQLDLKLAWLAKMPKRIKQLTARFLAERGLNREALARAGIEAETLALLW